MNKVGKELQQQSTNDEVDGEANVADTGADTPANALEVATKG